MRETPQAAKAFEQYYLLGDERTLAKLAHDIYGQNHESASVVPNQETFQNISGILSQLKKWSAAHKWQERVIERDRAAFYRLEKKLERDRERMNERHAAIGTTQQKKALEQIDALITAHAFGALATVQLLKLATELERLARGGDSKKIEMSGKDGGPIAFVTEWGGGALADEDSTESGD